MSNPRLINDTGDTATFANGCEGNMIEFVEVYSADGQAADLGFYLLDETT